MSPSEEERLASLEKRLTEIERRLDHLQGIPQPVSHSEPVMPPRQLFEPGPAPTPRPQLETRMGLTWINRVGALTLVLGAAFFFNYAVEAGWLGVQVRVVLGVAAGLAALVMAGRLWRSGQHIFAQGLSGTGIAILYLSFWAAWRLYHLVPYGAAFLLMALTTAGAVALSARNNSEAIAALGFFGGYSTPLLLDNGEHRPWLLLAYVLLLGAGALRVSRMRQWRWVRMLAFVGTAILYLAGVEQRPETRLVNTISVLSYYALFAGVQSRMIVCAAQALAALALAGIWPGLWPFGLIELALACAGLMIAGRRRWPAAASVSFGSFWLSYLVWHSGALPRPAPGAVFLFLTVGFLLFSLWPRKLPWGVSDLVAGAMNSLIYFGCAYFVLDDSYHAWRGLFALLLAAAHIAAARLLWIRDRNAGVLAAGLAWVFLALAVAVQFSTYRITIGWAIEAAVLAWIGRRMSEHRATVAALVLFAAVALRLLTIDMWMYPSPASYSTIVNGRFLTFAVVSVCLWIAARWTGRSSESFAMAIGGHVIILWGLALETFGWAARTAAPADLRSVESTAISILLAAYAVLLVAIGVAATSAMHRILGLGLIALVVVKLYLYDVWFLGLFYRMAAFAALGALLLAMSYVYSRSRERATRTHTNS